MRSRYPKDFLQSFWNLGIRDIIALLVEWDLLMLDPFVTQSYWDIEKQRLVHWDSSDENSVDILRWSTPVVDFVLDLENGGEEPSENLMSYLMFKVRSIRLHMYRCINVTYIVCKGNLLVYGKVLCIAAFSTNSPLRARRLGRPTFIPPLHL